MNNRNYTIIVILLSITLSACFGSGGGGGKNKFVPPGDLWTWKSGSDVVNQAGVYGTLGTADAANVPGARQGAVTWKDSSGHFWLFGGVDGGGTGNRFNDLWRWDGTKWTWMSGSNAANQGGTYSDPTPANNVPGARSHAVSWIDSSGNFWLFGGYGYDSGGSLGYLNDLWKWDGTNWTWVSGSNTRNQNGTYSDPTPANNVPGSRRFAVKWIDASDNLWLFGGYGYPASGPVGRLNDLWKWDGTNWTWVSGGNARNVAGVYGTQGIPDALNVPGTRQGAVSWIDASGYFWLFGGYGDDNAVSGSTDYLNDLWKWDGTNWIWMSGSDTVDQSGTYGVRGTASASNVPGARSYSTASTDASGKVWLFGGQGCDGGVCSTPGLKLNDLWRWDGSNWTWISGSDTASQVGSYGTLGTAATSNVPGARVYGVSWTDSSGNYWLFGGFGFDSAGSLGEINDLWLYKP